jgi:hypothetical protein
VVADAGTYVGVVPLTQAANVGDFTIKGASIYTQLVPSAQTETPISFVPPYAAAGLPVPGAAPVSYTASHAWNTSIKFNLPGGCLPGSLSIVTDGITIFDDAGLLKTASGTLGTIDYANGILSLNSGSMSNSKAITYTPAAQLQRAPQSAEIAVTPESRSQSYVGTVNPVPQPGTLAISYMAQGRWYVLSDGGNGSLKGLDASYGAGTFNKNTGAFVVTLGALPDVGSSLILTWNVPTQETQQPTAALKASQALQLAPPEGKSVQPGTLTITWPHESGTGTRTASATTSGELSGAATGSLNVAQNLLSFAPNVLPPVGALLTVDYVAGPKQEDSFAHPSRDGQGKVPVTATLGSIEPGSLEIEWNTLTDTAVLGVYTLQQIQAMGLGLWNGVDPTQYARDDGAGNVLRAGQVIGSVNYATGAVQFQPDVTLKIPSPVYGAQRLGWASGVGQMFRLNYGGISYVDAPSLYPNDESGYVKLRYNSAGSTSNHSETFAFSPSFRLVPGVNAQVVTGTVLLAIAGSQPWGDNGQGTLREFTPSGWVTRGSINYLSGAVTLTSWSAGATNSITRASCVTTVGENISSEYVFRTGAAPLAPRIALHPVRPRGGWNPDRDGRHRRHDHRVWRHRQRRLRHRPRAGAIWHRGHGGGQRERAVVRRRERAARRQDLPARAGGGLQPALQRRGLQLSAPGCGAAGHRPGAPAQRRAGADLPSGRLRRRRPHRSHHCLGQQRPDHRLRAGASVARARGRPQRRGDPHRLRYRSGSRHRHVHRRDRLQPASDHRAPHRGHGRGARRADQRRDQLHAPADARLSAGQSRRSGLWQFCLQCAGGR